MRTYAALNRPVAIECNQMEWTEHTLATHTHTHASYEVRERLVEPNAPRSLSE